jgi:ketosteroid isomerase-like protein
MKKLVLASLACATLAGCNATGDDAELQTLKDEAAIEKLLIGYYSHFGGSQNEDFAAYYTDDAVFDVNGIVSTGREEIVALYDGMGDEDAAEDENLAAQGVFHMLITNVEVDVEGDSATAKMYWTGVLNTDPFGPPTLQEHGREYDMLEKQVDGSWLISKRVVIADSAMPEMFRATYRQLPDFDIHSYEPPAPAEDTPAE